MAKEYFWGATLSKDEKTFKWDPESDYLDDEDDDEDDAISHFLFLKQAVLGVEAKDGERNVIEVETVNFDGETVSQPLLSLRLGLNESTNLDIGLQPPITFKLVTGSGPVFLSGQHALDLQEDEEFGRDFKGSEGFEMGDEDLDDEDEGEEEEEEEEIVKKILSTKGKDKKKAALKDVNAPKKGKGDEIDEDEDEDEMEEEEEEEEKQTGKGKKRPAPSAKGPAKKLAKVDKNGTSKRKVPNGSIENGHADDDEDDEEDDDDYKVEDEEEEEEATSGEEEEEEEDEEEDEEMALGDDDDEDDEDEDDEDDEEDDDEDEEEEESSPEKPAKKAKGKVNGTVKAKATPKSQPSKPKEKKEKKTYSVEDMKQDLMKSPSKPKKEDKFKNFVKSRFHVSDTKKIQELWGWYKSTQLK